MLIPFKQLFTAETVIFIPISILLGKVRMLSEAADQRLSKMLEGVDWTGYPLDRYDY